MFSLKLLPLESRGHSYRNLCQFTASRQALQSVQYCTLYFSSYCLSDITPHRTGRLASNYPYCSLFNLLLYVLSVLLLNSEYCVTSVF